MRFCVNQRIFETFPGLHIGVIVAHGIMNTGSAVDIQEMLRAKEKEIRAQRTLEGILREPRIQAWRNAYVVFGAKPKDHRSSVENLYRLILEGKEVRHISQFVDIYNLISLTHTVPVGAEDLDMLHGDLVLDFAGPNETPALLLGDKEPRAPHEGEVIYKDDVSFVCRRFNWREADRTKLTESTKDCIAVIEGLPPVTDAEVSAALDDLKTHVLKYCRGSAVSAILDKDNAEMSVIARA